jgi:hypothetical protein
LYVAPSCSPGYGSPGASPYTVTCTYSDGTVLTQVVSALGPQGGRFVISASRSLQLQFGRILTNGSNPTIAAIASGSIGNLVYTPAVAALNQAGCGGVGGNALSMNGSGTLNVNGDVVSNGSISVSSSTMRVAGDIYARCQSSVTGAVSACYSSGAATPCTYPDIAGATRAGFHLVDPRYPAPAQLGSGRGAPNGNVVLQPGIYSALPGFDNGYCWFLSGGIYDWQAGYSNTGDFVSNELKPPDEASSSNNTQRAANQFWDTAGVNCSGAYQLQRVPSARDVPTGMWSFVVTSTRTDTYNGVGYVRESAPSICRQVNVNVHFNAIQLTVSNVPGAAAYNIYAAPPGGNGCSGPFGLAATLTVGGSVLNTNTNPCPSFSGNGCSLGNESLTLDDQLVPPFAPNAAAAAGTSGSYPPDPEISPLSAGLPNQNPPRRVGAAGDRANENNCESIGGVYVSCQGPITPGAVEFYAPAGGCIVTGNSADTYVFSGYQYNWISVYEPPANSCSNSLGASGNSAFIGLVYAPGATLGVASPYTFEAAGTGGIMANFVAFTGTMPAITFSASYAPVPPASRIAG